MFVAVLQTIHNNIWDATMSTYTYLTQEETLSKKTQRAINSESRFFSKFL